MPDDFVKNPPLKRHAAEMANCNALNESITTMITNIRACEDPSIKDLVNLFTSFVEMQIEKENKEHITEERLSLVEEKCETQIKQIHELQEITFGMQISSNQTTTNVHECEASIHKLEQLKIENDLFITQIPIKPNAEEISKKILEMSNIPASALLNSYTFPMRTRHDANSTPHDNKSKNHAIVISFASHSDKVKFFAERKKLGPIKICQLLPNCTPKDANLPIRISNRLSTFNLKSLKALNAAKGAGLTQIFQLHNGLFRFKFTEEGQWNYISTDSDFTKLQTQDTSMN